MEEKAMGRKAKELSALEVGRLKSPGLWAVGGVAGLYISVNETGGRSWILRLMVGSKRREMGLGGYPDVTLAGAREKARAAREQVEQGIDPVLERKRLASAMMAAQASEITFTKATSDYIAAHGGAWKNPKHRAQWGTSLATYADPVIGRLQVQDIGQAHMLRILEPIWTTKTETASRVRGRIEAVLDWATVKGYRKGDNPARWQGHLDALLAAPGKVTKKEHFAAVALDDMGRFWSDLIKQKGTAAMALQFAILTAARSGEVRGMKWSEFDRSAGIWTVPADRMKAGKAHRVPLSDEAVTLLEAMPKFEGKDHVFLATRGGPLSDMAMTQLMRRMGETAVPHGFRSTFRDWAAERTNYPRDMAEMALAHTISNEVEAAYRRGDMLEKRRLMMQHWANFCRIVHVPGEVVPLHKKQG